jgi:hypothetical protein
LVRQESWRVPTGESPVRGNPPLTTALYDRGG